MHNESPKHPIMNNPDFAQHKGKSYTVSRWWEIIAELSDDPVYKSGQKGRVPRYSPELGIKLCADYLERGTMKQVMKEKSIDRTTVWRWKQTYPSFRYMLQLTLYIRKQHDCYEKMLKTRYGY